VGHWGVDRIGSGNDSRGAGGMTDKIDVTRFDLEQPTSHMGLASMQEQKHGDWVRHEDCAARLAEVEAERDQWQSECLAQNEALFKANDRADLHTAAMERAYIAGLEAGAVFTDRHEVGVSTRHGFLVSPTMLDGTQGKHSGMAYAAAIRALAADPAHVKAAVAKLTEGEE